MCYVFAAATEDQNQVSEEVNNAPKVYDQTPFVYTNDKVHITLVGNNDDKNSIKFDIWLVSLDEVINSVAQSKLIKTLSV